MSTHCLHPSWGSQGRMCCWQGEPAERCSSPAWGPTVSVGLATHWGCSHELLGVCCHPNTPVCPRSTLWLSSRAAVEPLRVPRRRISQLISELLSAQHGVGKRSRAAIEIRGACAPCCTPREVGEEHLLCSAAWLQLQTRSCSGLRW